MYHYPLYFFENSFHVVMLLCSEDDIEDIHKVSTNALYIAVSLLQRASIQA